MPLPAPRRQAAWAAVCVLLVALAGCAGAPTPRGVPLESRIAEASALIDAGKPADAARAFETLALANPARAAYLLARAAQAHAAAGDRAAAVAAHDRARALPQRAEDAGEVALARAAIARLDGAQDAVLAALAFDLRELPDELAARILLARADAEARLGSTLLALDDLVARDGVLDDEVARRANAERTWALLTSVSGSLDPSHLALNSPAGSRAWLELAGHARRAWQDPQAATAGVEAWREAHPGHPAAESIVPRLLEQIAGSTRYPEKVALLLPFTGRFTAQAEAVRDGFMAAHYASGRKPEVAVFDTTDYPGGATQALAAAQAWGAGFIVGPLTREAVTELVTPNAATGAPPPALGGAPMLALNYLETGAPAPEHVWQFGLLPEGEAEAVAEHAAALGYSRAVALHPKGDWGDRMFAAFKARFEALGGTVLSAQAYDSASAEKDFSTAITRMLNLDESRVRAGLVANVLGTKLEAEPRRRRDVEFVFLAARDRDAPLLRAQLRFHRASDLPTFATSAVYRTDGAPEADLDGVEFADMPWAIAADDPDRVELAALWPEGIERQARLYALGLDAYRLVPQLANLPAPLVEPVPGATGTLRMDDGRRVHRDLFWARFEDGIPVPVVRAEALVPAASAPPPAAPPPEGAAR